MKLTIKNKQNKNLAAILLKPAENVPVVIFSHGLNSGKDSPRNRAIAEALVKEHIAALLFDFTGHGESEGTIDDATIEQMADDLEAVIDFTKKEFAVIGVNGSSSGGTVALSLGKKINQVQALCLRDPPSAEVYDKAKEITVKTKIIQAKNSPLFEENKELAKYLKHAEVETIEHADHLFQDGFEEMVKATVKWFKKQLTTL